MATMNGIDISNHQGSMNLKNVLNGTNTKFVIMKVTEGTNFVDAYCDKFFQSAKAAGVCLGIYHFARPENNSAKAEAEFFYKNAKNYFKDAIAILDWESSAKWNVAWAKEWLDTIYKLTGRKPMIYMSESVVNAYNWSSVANANYGLWVAKYRDYGIDYNYNMSTAGSAPVVKWWKNYAMWQWTSVGRLTGYSGNLDCDIFYGDKAAWQKYLLSGSSSGKDVNTVYSYVNLNAKLPVLRKGAKGNAVKLVQMIVGAKIDGDFGAKTEAAVKSWQAAHGLTDDGVVGQKTWTEMLKWLETV